jgi:hypothetical protein
MTRRKTEDARHPASMREPAAARIPSMEPGGGNVLGLEVLKLSKSRREREIPKASPLGPIGCLRQRRGKVGSQGRQVDQSVTSDQLRDAATRLSY